MKQHNANQGKVKQNNNNKDDDNYSDYNSE